MNENIDLTKILKDCPMGWKLYSSIHGEVQFRYINNGDFPIVVELSGSSDVDFTKDGKFYSDYDGECVLLPSKDQRDWSKFTAPWYDTIDWLEKQGEQKKQVHFPKFTFDDVLALQCCMETVKKVQEDKELYEQLNLIHNKIYDAYCFGKQGETSPILSNSSNTGKNKPKFNPKTLQPFDKILGRGDTESPWQYQRTWCCATSSHINNDVMYPIKTTGDSYKYAVPYNDDTKHLIGTSEEAPEYYRYWED